MNDVLEEEAEHGNGDSIADDGIESAELEEALDKSILRDRLLILIKNDGSEEEVSDCDRNHILLKKGLDKEVSMLSVPEDWTPPVVAKAEKGEPFLFESVETIQESGPSSRIGRSS
jgi:hypothetical protein